MKMEFERHPGGRGGEEDPCPVFTIRYQLLFPASCPGAAPFPVSRHCAHRALRNFATELYVYGIRNLSTGGKVEGVVRAGEGTL